MLNYRHKSNKAMRNFLFMGNISSTVVKFNYWRVIVSGTLERKKLFIAKTVETLFYPTWFSLATFWLYKSVKQSCLTDCQDFCHEECFHRSRKMFALQSIKFFDFLSLNYRFQPTSKDLIVLCRGCFCLKIGRVQQLKCLYKC